jgi:predicted permease
MRNIRLAFRTLFKSPFVTVVAILSLALGIGANAAIYSLFDQIILAPLPVSEPDRLVNLVVPGPKPGSTTCNQAGDCEHVFSYPMYRDLEQSQTAFSGMAGHRLFSANVAYEGETLNGEGMLVSGSYFDLLGLRPARGRLIGVEDDMTIGGHPVVVVSHNFWRTRLGSDPNVIGRSITVNGAALDIIGIAPEGFDGTTLGGRPVVFLPLTMRAAVTPNWTGFDNRRSYWLYAFARLREGSSMEQATAAINNVYGPIVNDVEAPLQTGMSDQTMAQFRAKQITLEDGRRGQSSVHEEAKTPLLMLLATAGIVLLIACANIANLLLARGANRAMEMAVRLSLGASRRQVITQLLTESVLLGLIGGLVSLAVAHWTLAGIASLMPAEVVDALGFRMRWSVVAFAAGLSILTGLLFGMFPALHSTRSDLVSTIRSNAGNLSVTRGAARFRTSLVTAQIALSMALLIAAGLFLKSLVNVSRVDLGVRVDNIITFSVSPALNGYEPEHRHRLMQQIEDELAAVPGVTSVTSAMVGLIAGSNWGTDVNVQGFESGPDINSNARLNRVGPGYFGTIGVPVLVGREFTRADNASGGPVAVVNEAFIRKFGLGSDAVGKYMSERGPDEMNMEIVGVVKDAAYSEVKADVPALFFTPWRQDENVGSLSYYVASPLPPDQVMRSIRDVMRAVDPNLPVEQLKTMPQQIRENIMLDRMISMLSVAFAGLATVLASIGLYGVLAYTVETRTREIGVRMALGASAGAVHRMVLAQVVRMLAVGGVIGLIGAYFLGKAASSILFGMQGTDPLVFIGAAGMLTLLALAAGYIPAVRASRIQPTRALRYE